MGQTLQTRKAIRLRGYEYSSPGYYYITICTFARQLHFGVVQEDALFQESDQPIFTVNDRGRAVQGQWLEMGRWFPGVSFEEFCVLPDHVHGIIRIIDRDLCPKQPQTGQNEKAILEQADQHIENRVEQVEEERAERAEKGRAEQTEGDRAEQSPAPTIGDIVCAYKSITTKLCNGMDATPGRKLWQRNYFERIVRSGQELNEIHRYILENPIRWKEDEHYLFSHDTVGYV